MHIHRAPERCATCADWPEWAILIIEQQGVIMSQQDQVDNDVKSIAAAFAAEVADLKAAQDAGKPLDLTALDALASSVTASAATSAPAPAAPVDTPPVTTPAASTDPQPSPVVGNPLPTVVDSSQVPVAPTNAAGGPVVPPAPNGPDTGA
jgi:hypothetical protein